MTEFQRVNGPRVTKIGSMISTIYKSARSNKISGVDLTELMAPIANRLHGPRCGEVTVEAAPAVNPIKPPAMLRDTPHIHQIAGFVASLPREQLPSYITHMVNRLCERVEPEA